MRALLPSDPLRRRAVLVALLGVSGLYFVHTYVHRPRSERADALQLRIGQVATLGDRPDAGTAPGPHSAEQDLAALAAHLVRLEALLPAEGELTGLVEAISVEERRSGVVVTMLKPGPREVGEVYDDGGYEVVARGGYHQIASFVTAIASGDRILVPADVDIVPETAPGSNEAMGPAALTARFRVRTRVGSSDAVRGTAVPFTPHAASAGPAYERERFVYVARRRDPFLPPGHAATVGASLDEARIMGLIHHDRADLSVLLLGTVRFGDDDGDPSATRGRPPHAVRLRLGQSFGNARLVEIHPDHVLFQVDTPAGLVHRVLRVPQTDERSPS